MFGGGRPKQDVIEVPKLEPKDLYDRRKRRDFARLRSYNTLLQQIYHRVYSSSQLPVSTCSVLYTVPPFIIGLPKIDMEDCVVYIVFQLRQAGFEVRFTWPNILYISWKHHEGNYLTSHNPIVQAMLHEANANAKASANANPFTHTLGQKGGSQKKKAPLSKKDAKFNEDIDFLIRGSLQEPALLTSGNEGSPFGSAPPVAPRRSPLEYKPPESFIQTMERPGPGRQINSISGAPTASKPNNVLSELWSL